MSLFDLLVVAHLVGDWMFQTDWMAKYKRGQPWSAACLSHCLVYTTALLAGLGLANAAGIATIGVVQAGGAAFFLFVTHWLIDGFALPRTWAAWVNHTDKEFVLIVVDQTMHLATLGWLAWWLAGGAMPSL